MTSTLAYPEASTTLHGTERNLRTQPKKIMLATDLGDLEHTFPIVAAQARLYGSEILVAHVLPDFSSPSVSPSLLLVTNPDQYIYYAEEVLGGMVRRASAEGLSISYRMLQGSVTEQTELLTEEWQPDRVVVGCQGAEKLYLRLLGSNAERIFRQTRVPVLAIGPHARLQPGQDDRRMRVLIPVSLRRKSQFLFQFAAMFAESDQVDVTVLHVVEDSSVSHLEPANVRACEAALRSQVAMYADGNLPSCLVQDGCVTSGILETAVKGNFDMVVLGNTSPSSFLPRPAPSAAFEILSGAPCPVLVVKDEEACTYGC